MKTLRLSGLLLFSMLAFFVASCGGDSSDDSGSGGGSGNLTPPKYESSSALYSITDANSAYKSVEFTASGNYVVTMKHAPKVPRRIAAMNQFRFGFIPQHAGMTRNVIDDDIIYGTYTKNGDTYELEGFGTIVVNGGGSSAVSLDITTTNGTKVTVGAQQQQQYSSSTKTNMLCRTWKMGKVALHVAIPGYPAFDQTYNSWADFVRGYLKMEGYEEGSPYYESIYKEMMEESPNQVIFTKSGTYVVFYSNKTLGVSTWKWVDENAGKARYSWDYQSINDPNESGAINIDFVGNQLVITEFLGDEYDNPDDYDDDEIYVEGTIKWYLTEVK